MTSDADYAAACRGLRGGISAQTNRPGRVQFHVVDASVPNNMFFKLNPLDAMVATRSRVQAAQ